MPDQPPASPNQPPPPKSPEFSSIFDGEPEMPAAGAQRIDEKAPDAHKAASEIDAAGHLKASAPLGDVDPFDHSAEQDAIDGQKSADGVAPPPLPTDEPTGLNNPNVMMSATDKLQDEMERRFRLEMGDTNIQVTAADRDAFVRAALTDAELLFTIPVEGLDATVTVALAPDEFTTSVAAAVTQLGKEGHIDKDSDLQWLLAFQQLHAWYQVRAINGEPTPWSDYWADGFPPLKDVRARMRDYESFQVFHRMNATRWRMLLEAIRTAEHKYKVCLHNWKNRSFFTGADTD